MPNTKNPTRTSASQRKATAIPRGFRKQASWWRSEAPKLIEQINVVLADANQPKGPRAVLIEPRFVSFPLQSELTGVLSRSKMGEVCYGLPLPSTVTLGDIGNALQGDALHHLVAAHLWLQEVDAISLRGPGGMQSPSVSTLIEHLKAAAADFSAAVEGISASNA
ncbi:hypothetical protein G6L85_15480 [Agrobacterium rhizogenes]|uniref:hypothetical protein n=1 Tax=Rhizobium rhizogenes TaxID=359 RepID=UPI0015723FA8|nr:hypothetical protein [Rhizobium rhizogenes]NTI62914.1 hypothetical protein [Rhizobium rhizogenes]